MKIGRNDPCPCGSGKKYKKCCIDKERKKDSFTGECLPVYKCWISRPNGSRIAVGSRIKPNGNYEMASMLVDEWKMGLKDGFGNHSLSKQQLDYYIGSGDFREVNIEECKKLIKKGILIANDLGFSLPKEYERYKGIIGNMDDIAIRGSLYKCFACGENDLSEETASMIREVTLKDVKKGVCGTPNETIIYFACEKCKVDESEEDEGDEDTDEECIEEEDGLWEKGFFTEGISPNEMKEKAKTIHKGHDEDMKFNCKKCNAKISAHNKDWHAGMCDKCFNREVYGDES